MEVSTWLRSLGLGGSTALAARLDVGDLGPGVADGLVGLDDAIGASGAPQGGKPAAPEAATVR